MSSRTDFQSTPARAPARAQAATPLYLAVHRALREAIQAGRFEVGHSLPSEAALSRSQGVSRITIRHALRLLEADGYIRKAQARRPVVIAARPRPRSGWVLESLDDIVAMVAGARLAVKSFRLEREPEPAERLGLAPATRLHCLRSILLRDERAYARSIIYFPPEIGRRLSRKDFDDTVVFRVLQRELGIRLADVTLTIWAETANEEDAAAIACERGAAILVMQLLYQTGAGEKVELAYSRSLASEVRLSTRLTASPRHS